MKIVITGFAGFVSRHLLELLNQREKGADVLGIDKHTPDFEFDLFPELHISFIPADLTDAASTGKILHEFKPDHIVHLASVSSVARSWQTPAESFANNTAIFLNLAEYLRLTNKQCRLLSVGSSEEFGVVAENMLPLTEQHALNPLNPYAAARVSQEMLSKIYADGYGLDIIMTRSFNHIGPGQKENFVISSFVRQMVLLKKNNTVPAIITTGDLSIVRDFTDVRDIVSAYYLLLKKGIKGDVYNICSGKGVMLKDIIDGIATLLDLKISTRVNPELVRPAENKKVIGSYQKIKDELGWEPAIPLQKSLSDIIAYWQQQLQN